MTARPKQMPEVPAAIRLPNRVEAAPGRHATPKQNEAGGRRSP